MYTKRLYKSKDNKVLFGIIGGLGEYFDVDPVILRLAYLIIVIGTGVFPGILAYIIAGMIVPEKPLHKEAPFTETPKD
jgi:phage shock protein C